MTYTSASNQVYGTGHVTVLKLAGGPPGTSPDGRPQASSFFDIFTEVSLDGSPSTRVAVHGQGTGLFTQASGTSSPYDTEMLSMSLSGGGGGGGAPPQFMIRESPTRASTGRTSLVADAGAYTIDSFFDIFTELSVDGGPWIPSAGSLRVSGSGLAQGVPEPSTLTLLGTAGIGLLALAWRRRRRSA